MSIFAPDMRLYSTRESAKKLKIPYVVLLKYLKDGKLKCYKFSDKKRLISEEHIREFLKSIEE